MYTYDGIAKNKSNKIGAVKLGGTAFFHSSQIKPKGPDHKKIAKNRNFTKRKWHINCCQ